MIVFKTFFKILNKLKGMLILYTVMLVSITLINQNASNSSLDFVADKPNILIVNNQNDNYLAKDFTTFLENNCVIKDIDINDESKIDDAIFYRDVDFVIYIDDDYFDKFMSGQNVDIKYKSSNNANAHLAKMLVEKYLKTALIYKDIYQGDELIHKINNVLRVDSKVLVKQNLDTSNLSRVSRYFNFLNYAYLAGCLYCISMILSSLKDEKIFKRTIISSFDYKKYNRIVLLSCAILIIGMWFIYTILSLILFKNIMFSLNGLLYIINSLIFALCSLTLGFLIGNITQNKNAISGIINVVALGSSFLCGCFVPFEYMPDYVLKLAHILPTYYFVLNNELIKTVEDFNFKTLSPLVVNGVIVIVFSILFIILTNYISKRKQVIN